MIERASHGNDKGIASISRHVGLEEPEISDAVYGEPDDELRGRN